MSWLQHVRRIVITFSLVLVMITSVACSAPVQERQTGTQSQANPTTRSFEYGELARGDTAQGQRFGDWVVQTSQGLIKDAYVRDNDKLGVVISKQVKPAEVKPLTQSLVQGFRRSAPNRNLTVLVYDPNKELILTARYNAQSRQVEYSG